MKITFDGQTLADPQSVTAVHGLNAVIEQWGAQSTVQTEKRYGQNTEVDFPRGNIGGDFVFTVTGSYGSYAGPVQAFAAAIALLNIQATLMITFPDDETTATMANAICRDVHRVMLNGHSVQIRYSFKITTITSP